MTRRRKIVIAILATIIPIFAMSCFWPSPLKDYARLQRLHRHASNLTPGMSSSQIIDLIGKPDRHGTGSCVDANGIRVKTTTWTYQTHYDWDGIRTRWNYQSFFPYWLSRLSPGKDSFIDDVLCIHIADDVLVSVRREDESEGLFFRTR